MRKLKVLSFNCGLLRVVIKGKKVFEFTPYLEERFQKIVSALKTSNYDVICLQEIYNKQDTLHLIEQLNHQYPYSYNPRADYYLRYSSGLVILSKLPLKNPQFHKFNNSTWDERLYVDKGFIETFVDFDDYLVQLVNAHTTAGGYFRHPEHKKVDYIRHTQIEQILKTKNPEANMTLITGDLNCGPQVSKENFELFKNHQFADVFEFRDDENYTWDSKNPLNIDSPHATSPSQRIDHILYQVHEKKEWIYSNPQIVYKEPEVELTGRLVTLSDHYGVEATLLS